MQKNYFEHCQKIFVSFYKCCSDFNRAVSWHNLKISVQGANYHTAKHV